MAEPVIAGILPSVAGTESGVPPGRHTVQRIAADYCTPFVKRTATVASRPRGRTPPNWSVRRSAASPPCSHLLRDPQGIHEADPAGQLWAKATADSLLEAHQIAPPPGHRAVTN